jgi:hypothetical protein
MDNYEKATTVFGVIGLIVGIGLAVVWEYSLMTSLKTGRYPILIFGLPLVAGALVAFVIAMIPLAWLIIMSPFQKKP